MSQIDCYFSVIYSNYIYKEKLDLKYDCFEYKDHNFKTTKYFHHPIEIIIDPMLLMLVIPIQMVVVVYHDKSLKVSMYHYEA